MKYGLYTARQCVRCWRMVEAKCLIAHGRNDTPRPGFSPGNANGSRMVLGRKVEEFQKVRTQSLRPGRVGTKCEVRTPVQVRWILSSFTNFKIDPWPPFPQYAVATKVLAFSVTASNYPQTRKKNVILFTTPNHWLCPLLGVATNYHTTGMQWGDLIKWSLSW